VEVLVQVRKTWALGIVGLVSFTAVAAKQPLAVSVNGRNSEVTVEALDRIGAKPVTIVDVLESSGKKKAKVEYTGYPVATVLDTAFGNRDAWKQSKEVVFECADGFKAKVPTEHLAKKKGYLVYERKGDANFTLTKNSAEGQRVNLAPFYLVWDDRKMQSPKAAAFWPYQVVAVRLEP
jgi:hypothetical protein